MEGEAREEVGCHEIWTMSLGAGHPENVFTSAVCAFHHILLLRFLEQTVLIIAMKTVSFLDP